MLQKRDFWHVASNYKKLKQVERLHQKFKVSAIIKIAMSLLCKIIMILD